MRCPECGGTFEAYPDEQQFDYCPRCGYEEPTEPTEPKLKTYTPERGKVVVVAEIPNCYFCEQMGKIKPGPYDFATRFGPWANGCEYHFQILCAGAPTLGTGKAQLWITQDQVTP